MACMLVQTLALIQYELYMFIGVALLGLAVLNIINCLEGPRITQEDKYSAYASQLSQRSENGLFPGPNHPCGKPDPILAPKVRDRRKREIEAGLYPVFRKYAPGRAEMRWPDGILVIWGCPLAERIVGQGSNAGRTSESGIPLTAPAGGPG